MKSQNSKFLFLMKMILTCWFAVSFTSSQSQAQQSVAELRKAALESQKECQNFVRFDDNFLYLGFGAYKRAFEEPRFPIPGMLKAISLRDPSKVITIKTSDSVIDVVSFSDRLYVLTYSGLQEWNLLTQEMVFEHPTNFENRILEYKEHPQGMVMSHGKIYIAHGRLGLAIFDLLQNKVVKMVPLMTSQAPLESMATSVAAAGHDVYISMDSFTLANPDEKPAFRGIIAYNPMEEKITRQMIGLDPGNSSMTADSKYLVVSYMGYPVWKYDRSELVSEKLPRPVQSISTFKEPGHPTGSAFMDDEYYYTCYMKHNLGPNPSAERVTRAIKRSDLGL